MFVLTNSFAVGDQPVSVSLRDLNADGDLDVVVGNATSNDLSILLGDGSGGFTAAAGSPIATGGVQGHVIADFNGDGRLDIAVAARQTSAVRILLGDGAGGFTQAAGSPIALTGTITGIATADFDGDGILDLIAGDTNNSLVHVLKGAGDGSFASVAGSPLAVLSLSGDPLFADIDGDGDQDFLVGVAPDEIRLYSGDGTGGFALRNAFTAHTNPVALVAADLDGDGDLDVVSANRTGDSITVLLMDGTGGGALSTFMPAGDNPLGLLLLDADFDGDLDVVVTNANTDQIAILAGDGAGRFTASATVAVGDEARVLASGDVNGDGRADLVVVNQGDDTVSILLNTGLAIADATARNEGLLGGATTFTFTVTRFGSTAGAASADWTVTGSGASASDFVGGVFPSGTVTFANGQATATISIDVRGDADREESEGFTVTLSNPTGIDLEDSVAVSAIADDDTPMSWGEPAPWYGTEGGNRMDGGFGPDALHGRGGDDDLSGGLGDDLVQGNAGNDVLNGNPGEDTVHGGQGADTVRGGAGHDRVFGDLGDDWLSGDRGDDTLTGGAGADTFHVFAGRDLITDFDPAEGDRLQLLPGAAWSVSQVGADAVIDLGDGGLVILAGVQLASLGTGWIV